MTAASTSTITGAGRRLGYGVLLGDKYFTLATAPDRKVEITTAPLEAPRIDTGVTAEDVSNEFGDRYSRSDFSGGEGLMYAHRPGGASDDGSRYFDSRNVDIDDDGNVTLLKAPEVVDAITNTVRLAYVDGDLLATDGTNVRLSSNPQDATPTFADEDVHVGEGATTVADLVGVGTTAYAAVGDGIHRKTSGGAWAHWHTLSGIERLWAAKGRVFVAVGNVLYELDTGATPTATAVLTIAVGETINDLCDAGAFVLVTASDGNVHALTDNGGATLEVAGQSYLEGETPYAIAASRGVVIFGTSAPAAVGSVGRLYRAQVGTDGVLSGVQRLRKWQTSSITRTPYAAFSHADSIYVGVDEDGTNSNLWRFDLANGALHRSHIFAGTCRDIGSVGDTLWWGGDGLFRVSDTYEAQGWITSPLGDLLTAQEKAWASLSVTFSGLSGTGEAITAKYTTKTTLDTATYSPLSRWTTGDRTVEAVLPNVTSRYLAVRMVLDASNDASATPTLRSFSARAYPQSDELIVRFWINVSDQIERPGKARVNVRNRGRDTLDAIVALENTATTLELAEVGEELRGIVEQVVRPVDSRSRLGEPGLYARVTFRGSRLTEDASTEGLLLFGTTFVDDGAFATERLFGKASA